MNCGTVLYDKNFQFPNQRQPIDKLLIILCECGTDHLVLIATSQQHARNKQRGCQVTDKLPNYFLPGGSSWFKLDTWVELQEVHEFPAFILNQKIKDRTIEKHEDALLPLLMRQILECALQSQFIDPYHLTFLRKQLDKL